MCGSDNSLERLDNCLKLISICGETLPSFSPPLIFSSFFHNPPHLTLIFLSFSRSPSFKSLCFILNFHLTFEKTFPKSKCNGFSCYASLMHPVFSRIRALETISRFLEKKSLCKEEVWVRVPTFQMFLWKEKYLDWPMETFTTTCKSKTFALHCFKMSNE